MSKFQERHYVAIAEVISDAKKNISTTQERESEFSKYSLRDAQVRYDIAELIEIKLTKLFESDNEKFDAGRFAAACVPEGK